MAETLPNGVVIPLKTEPISATGVAEMRTVGSTADTSIGAARFTKNNPGPFNFDTMKDPGTYSLGSPFPTGWTNVPPGITTASIFNVYGSPVQSWCAQEIIQYGSNPRRLWRISSTTAGWNAWVQIGGDGDVSSAMGGNAARQTDFVSTTGGVVNTGGRAAFALRLDHGWTNIKSKLRAGLIARGIVPGVASCSRQWDLEENSGATIAEVKSWVAAGEFEILNQGATHGQAMVNYVDEIVNGKAELETQLDTNVWGFAPPGESTTWEDFGGGSVDGWASLPAGIALASHAYSMGYVGGARRVLDGTIRQGLSHITLDTYDMAQARAQVDAAIAEGRGIQVMLHPRELDKTGKITTADFLSFLDYVVGKRDAGDLVILSPGELVRADATPPPSWGEVTGKPSTYTPATHTHPVADVTGLQAALDGKARKEPIDLADQNLNDVIDEGPYVQTSGAAANAERNYPATASGARQAGLLEVTSRPGDYLVFQRYTTFNGGEMFFRARYGGTWYAWERAFRATEATPMQAQLADLAYKSGRRNITSLFTPAPASGAVYIERRGGTVWLHVDNFVPSVAGDTLYSNVIPAGFQIVAPAELPASPRVPTDPQGNFRTYSHVLGFYRQELGKQIRGLVSWPTDQAIPTTLPGAPA